MTDIAALKLRNAVRWERMTVSAHIAAVADMVAARLTDPARARARYLTVQAETKVPWPVIAVIHEREASQSWAANLAQGDPWDRASIHVPRHRGPFESWEAAAVDALTACAPYAARWTDWSIGGALTLLEEYNGLGYAFHGVPSPYLWAGSNQYSRGKYVADGHFDPHAIDTQLGCAVLLARMRALDSSITLGDEAGVPGALARRGAS
jgi:lysozyme family protein